MPITIVADIQKDSLNFKPEDSDRLVYSNYFVPLELVFEDGRTPMLPFYRKQEILEVARSGLMNEDRLREILRGIGFEALWDQNHMDEAKRQLDSTQWRSDGPAVHEINSEVARAMRDARGMAELLSERLRDADREVARMISQRLENLSVLQASDERASAVLPRAQSARRPTVLDSQEYAFISGLIAPDVGFVFLDRTRITPVGFALGEHVYALGLAPGEEVVLEQKTFTKRQMTLEEQTDQEKQFDLELASTYSTEIQEGFERQRSLTETSGLSATHTGQYTSEKFSWGQITASATIGATKNVTDANQVTSRRSVKDSQTASGKVAAKYRTQHKTTFRVVTEVGFESTSKRTIKNPNRTTSLTLHYFKVLQKLRMKQERYGARLCWTVHVKDPAATFFAKMTAAREKLIADALKALPPQPVEPAAPAGDGSATTKRQTQVAVSPIVVADKWVAWAMSAEYDVDIPIPTGFTWDGTISNRQISIFSGRPDHTISRWIVGSPYPVDGNALRVKVHIGTNEWVLGPGISFQVQVGTYQDVMITERSSTDARYADDLAMYRTALKQWQDNRDIALEEAHAAAADQDKRFLSELSPINEMISQIIEQNFPASVRDTIWEIDFWQRVFDWERATFAAYPSWWAGPSTRDPLLDPSDFINASWAKLYLPVRLGMERPALRWMFGKVVEQPLAPYLENSFDRLVSELEAYRREEIGAAGELEELTKECQPIRDLCKCIATWEELMPTDGTHIEVVQGATDAADPVTTKEIADATALRAAQLAGDERSTELKKKAEGIMTQPASVAVQLH